MRKILRSQGAEVYQISYELMNVNCEFLTKPTKWTIHCVENFMLAKCQHKFTDDNIWNKRIQTIYSCSCGSSSLSLSSSVALPSDLTVNYVFLFLFHSPFAILRTDTISLCIKIHGRITCIAIEVWTLSNSECFHYFSHCHFHRFGWM